MRSTQSFLKLVNFLSSKGEHTLYDSKNGYRVTYTFLYLIEESLVQSADSTMLRILTCSF